MARDLPIAPSGTDIPSPPVRPDIHEPAPSRAEAKAQLLDRVEAQDRQPTSDPDGRTSDDQADRTHHDHPPSAVPTASDPSPMERKLAALDRLSPAADPLAESSSVADTTTDSHGWPEPALDQADAPEAASDPERSRIEAKLAALDRFPAPVDTASDPVEIPVPQSDQHEATLPKRQTAEETAEPSAPRADEGVELTHLPGPTLNLADLSEDAEHSPDQSAPVVEEPEEGRPSSIVDAADEISATTESELPAQPRESPTPNESTEYSDQPRPSRTLEQVWSKHPEDYNRPDRSTSLPEISGPQHSPAEWADKINPDKAAPGRDNNCGDCTRATELTWWGTPSVAASLSDQESPGEPIGRMEEWAGAEINPTSSTEIAFDLRALGPGSSAIILVEWEDTGAHWFNAVNENGSILSVDAQSGATENWPPTMEISGFSDELITGYWAILMDENGTPMEWIADD